MRDRDRTQTCRSTQVLELTVILDTSKYILYINYYSTYMLYVGMYKNVAFDI